MHSAAADERDQLRKKVRLLESDLVDARRESAFIESSSNIKLTGKDRIISELYATVVELTGVEPYTRLPDN